jgi:dTDP-4-dehydrorhamnose reductase
MSRDARAAVRHLVVGAGGQVGGALRRALGAGTVGTWRDPPPGGLVADLEALGASPGLADDLLGRSGASVVHIAAGMTHVDGCEDDPGRARLVNRDAPAALARAARSAGARTVYFSTEYVFDGRAGPYGEDDRVNPLSAYGRTKLEGEEAVRAEDSRSLVVRTTVVYGPEEHGRNFAYQLLGRLRRGETMAAAQDQVSSPTYNADLATAVIELVGGGAEGILHVAGPEIMDRATFARRLAAAMGLDPAAIRPVATSSLGQRAPRPLDAGLRVDRLRELLPHLQLHDVERAVAHWGGTGPAPWGGSGG